MKVIKRFITDKAVGYAKLFLENNGVVQGRNAADSADLNLFKVNTSDELEFLNAMKIPAPSAAMSPATKTYVDTEITNNIVSYLNMLPSKDPVKVASTANIDLATGGLLTIDGVALSANDRVLVKNQTLPEENGIYLAASGAWTRALDANHVDEFKAMTLIGIDLGSTYADQLWAQSSSKPATLGVSAITYSKIGPAVAVTVPVWAKEDKTLSGGDITNGYVDLAQEIEANSLSVMIDGIMQDEGSDYTLSLEGGVTRITFAGDLLQVIAGDVLRCQYQY